MKNLKVILCALVCVLGLTACGGNEKVLSQDTMMSLQSQTINYIQVISNYSDNSEQITSLGADGVEAVFDASGMSVEGNGIINAFSSWASATEEFGDLVDITDMQAGYDDQGSDIIVTVDIMGTKGRKAQVEAVYEDNYNHTLKSLTTNIDWTFGEKMSKAGLNTLMGMGTVFLVLILISLIISLFGLIPVIQDKLTKKNKDVKTEAVDNTIAQIVEKEEQTDDLELIAVITAAIAASGTSGSSDDFVVRSIRRRPNSQWNKA